MPLTKLSSHIPRRKNGEEEGSEEKGREEKGHEEKGSQEKGHQEKGHQEKGHQEKGRKEGRQKALVAVNRDEKGGPHWAPLSFTAGASSSRSSKPFERSLLRIPWTTVSHWTLVADRTAGHHPRLKRAR